MTTSDPDFQMLIKHFHDHFTPLGGNLTTVTKHTVETFTDRIGTAAAKIQETKNPTHNKTGG